MQGLLCVSSPHSGILGTLTLWCLAIAGACTCEQQTVQVVRMSQPDLTVSHVAPDAIKLLEPWTGPPAFAPAPGDPKTRDLIALSAKYAVQNGPSFIDVIRDKQRDNPQYTFLTAGGQNHPFYKWVLYCILYRHPLDQPLQQQAPAAPAQVPAPSVSMAPMPAEVASGFNQVLDALSGSKVQGMHSAHDMHGVPQHGCSPA